MATDEWRPDARAVSVDDVGERSARGPDATLRETSSAPIAWVLNLDADLELAAYPRRYEPTNNVRTAMKLMAATLARTLLGPDDVWLEDGAPSPSRSRHATATTAVTAVGAGAGAGRGLRGRAFCPTPRALQRLRAAGALVEPTPSVEILRAVNSRAFATALGPTLPEAEFVTALDLVIQKLTMRPPVGLGTWRTKRAFGMSGRGQRVIAPASFEALSDADRNFLRSALAEGGLQIEPNVLIEREYAIHGLIEPNAVAGRDADIESGSGSGSGSGMRVTMGEVVLQRCDAAGGWLGTEPIIITDGDEQALERTLREEALRVAAALRAAGYFGPFGVDAYTYRGPGGSLCLQPRGEINARFSMGWSVGFHGSHKRPRPV